MLKIFNESNELEAFSFQGKTFDLLPSSSDDGLSSVGSSGSFMASAGSTYSSFDMLKELKVLLYRSLLLLVFQSSTAELFLQNRFQRKKTTKMAMVTPKMARAMMVDS